MHPNDDLLRALIDRELPEGQSRLVDEHLSRCPNCHKRLVEMRARAGRVHTALHTLTPLKGERTSSPSSAYARLFRRDRTLKSQTETLTTMFTKRTFWAALTVIAVLAIALSLTPVRAWASDVLRLFRVQRVAVVEFDPAAAERAQQGLEANRERFEAFMQDVEITGGGEVQEAATSEVADS